MGDALRDYTPLDTALHSFSMTLRAQLAAMNVKVYKVIPPEVHSELNYEGRKKTRFPERRYNV